MISNSEYLSLLQNRFGFKEFRHGQREAIQTLLLYHRVLCIQPTGHGKSLLYQFPTLLLDGITLVISPLLALMRDQIDQLNHRFHISAASINSDQSEDENAQAIQLACATLNASEKGLKVLFVSPEQLDHIDRFEFILQLPISLVVIDEAHCISTWGHDFRPSYRKILDCIQSLEKRNSNLKILGLTATADARVEKDIERQLTSLLQKVHVLRESMDRPNIHLSVISTQGTAAKLILCKILLLRMEGSGIIYCATRENTELVAEYLCREGISVVAYHAGLESEQKRDIQTAFSKDRYKAVAATTALGMGIDKGNLRFIIHFDIPGSITAYYQEVGRCGRDGNKAQGILLYDPSDRKVQEYFIDSALPEKSDFEEVIKAVRTSEEMPNLTKIKRMTGLHPTRVTIILAELMEQQQLKKQSVKGSQVYQLLHPNNPLDLTRYTNQHLVKSQELDRMIAYAEQSDRCRMAILRSALGDEKPSPCNHCDVCLRTIDRPQIASHQLLESEQWLSDRPVPIAAVKTYRLLEGISLMDGKLHTPLFVHFMKSRAHLDKIDPALLSLLIKQTSSLVQHHSIAAIVPLPSTTWMARDNVAFTLGRHFNLLVLSDLLFWETPPEKRQGELLNNDQRAHNVKEKMRVNGSVTIPSGSLLLLDDYIGSGSTMKEAARALCKAIPSPLVPLTIAALKWRLGKSGFI